jgi:hypothetical protein
MINLLERQAVIVFSLNLVKLKKIFLTTRTHSF